MCRTVVEATGKSAVAEKAWECASPLGEVILLGTPRGRHETDITELLRHIHLYRPHGCITYRGAHEFCFPVKRDPDGFTPVSIEDNIHCLLRLLIQKRLVVENLITHTVHPSECGEVYKGLKANPDEYMGVVVEWK